MTLLLSCMQRNFRPFPSIWRNFTSHRASQYSVISHIQRNPPKIFYQCRTSWNAVDTPLVLWSVVVVVSGCFWWLVALILPAPYFLPAFSKYQQWVSKLTKLHVGSIFNPILYCIDIAHYISFKTVLLFNRNNFKLFTKSEP